MLCFDTVDHGARTVTVDSECTVEGKVLFFLSSAHGDREGLSSFCLSKRRLRTLGYLQLGPEA
jgi:hypothetical protein